MAKRNFDTRIEELRRKEEELRVERQRIESAKREHERRERARRLSDMGRTAESYGLGPQSLAALLERLTGAEEGVRMLEVLGVPRTNKWESRSPGRGSDGAARPDPDTPARAESGTETAEPDTPPAEEVDAHTAH